MATGFTGSTPYPITRRRPERILVEPTDNLAKKPVWDTCWVILQDLIYAQNQRLVYGPVSPRLDYMDLGAKV